LKEKEIEKDDDEERQTWKGKGKKTRLDSELKKTRIEIPGLY
jgi:hypothetical protein